MGGLIGLVFQIDADPSKAQAAIANFSQQTGQSIGMVQAQIKDYTRAESAAYDEAVQRARHAGQAMAGGLEGADSKLLDSRESVRLLAEQFGIRLPRAVASAISKVEGLSSVLKVAGEAALTVFALREVAEAITNWDHFKDKVTEIIGPFSDLEIKVANALGFLKEYSKEARAAAEAEKKDVLDGLALAERVQTAQKALNLMRTEGVAKIRLESQQKVQGLEQELAKTDQANKAQFQHLINIEKETEKEKERQYYAEQAQEAEHKAQEAQRRRDEQERKSQEQLAHQREIITGLFEKFYISLNDIDPIEQKFIHNEEEIARVTDAATRALLNQLNEQERAKAVTEELDKTQEALAKTMAAGMAATASARAAEQKSQERQMEEASKRAVKELMERAKEMHLAWMEMYTDEKIVTEYSKGSLIPQFNYAAASLHNLKIIGLDSLNSVEQAMGSNLAMAIAYGQNVGQAMKRAAQEEVASIAEKSLVKSLEALATGFYLLAVQDYTGAGQAFTSAALWGAIGGAAAVASRAMNGPNAGAGVGSGASTGGGSGVAPGAAEVYGPQTVTPGVASVGGRFGSPGSGVVIIRGTQAFEDAVAHAVNGAVSRGVTVTATRSQRGAPVGH